MFSELLFFIGGGGLSVNMKYSVLYLLKKKL